VKKLVVFTLVCVLLISCGKKSLTQKDDDIQYKGDTILVKANSPALKQLTIETTKFQNHIGEFKTVGTVRPVAGKLAEIAPPFSGRIAKSSIRLGQKVSAGSTIFELSSSDFYDAAKAYFAAQSANELAKKNYNRQKDLAANGVASQKDLEQALSEANIASQELEQAKATLKIFNIEASSLQMGQPLKVTTPISGEVVKYNITIGSYVKEDSEPLAIVADLSTVWVAALVKEKYFGVIKPGDRVEIFSDAHPEKTIWGTIYNIGEMLDEASRSLEVIIECNNADKELKLGMFTKVHFLNSPSNAIILPSTAIMKSEENDFVLVETKEGVFIRRHVEVETINQDSVNIISGLSEGERVIVKGGIILN